MPSVVIQEAKDLTVPRWVVDLPSFTCWAESESFPEQGRIDYVAGEIWIDMSDEEIWAHNQITAEATVVLGSLAKTARRGRFFQNGLRILHSDADLAATPDGLYIRNETFETLRAMPAGGERGRPVRVEGSPDMVLEVLSDSSVRKDLKRLRDVYWKADIPEYWIIDARKQPLTFEILRRTSRGYVRTRPEGGWLRSKVFGKSFRLLQGAGALGHPTFTLEVR
jgi:Uma2 family endonuclease